MNIGAPLNTNSNGIESDGRICLCAPSKIGFDFNISYKNSWDHKNLYTRDDSINKNKVSRRCVSIFIISIYYIILGCVSVVLRFAWFKHAIQSSWFFFSSSSCIWLTIYLLWNIPFAFKSSLVTFVQIYNLKRVYPT